MISQLAKLSVGLSSNEWGNYKRTWQGALAALLLYLYNLHVVHATTILTDPKVHASTSCPLLIHHASTLRPPCHIHVPWCHTFNLRCTCVHHVYTIVRHSSHRGESPQNGLGDEQTLWNDLGFSLCAALPVCRVVATSDEGEKVQVEVSAKWCVTVEHQRSSSIRDYLRRLSD